MRPALALPLLGIAMLLAGCTDAIQLEAELSTTRAELIRLKSSNAQTVSQLTALQKRHAGEQTSHGALGVVIQDRDGQIRQLESDVRDRDQVITALRDAESRLQADKTSLTAERDQLRTLVATYLVQLTSQKADIERLTAAVKTLPTAPPPLPSGPQP